jgi:hypothetical protein
MVGSSSYQISHQSLTDNPRDNHKIVLWVKENSHVMLFWRQSLLQLRSHSYFLSNTLMGSIYLCYVNFLLVAFGNDVMTNDWWCRDDTESLLWCTHGWAARHALVSRLIVMIHYETILMCYLLWTFSQNDRCILSPYVAIFYPNQSSVSCQILSHEFASISSLGVTCFSTLKDPHPNLGTRFFLRGKAVTPQVSVSCYVARVILISDAQWKFLFLDRVYLHLSSYLWRFHRFLILFDRENQPILEPVKTFISRNECKLDNQSRIINLIWSSFNQLSTTVIWSKPESNSSNLDRCPTILIRVRTLRRNTQYVVL